jgi:putative ABC transport system ATP-binding protein
MSESIIQLRGIAKVYRVGVETIHALRGVDLDIGRNEMVAIMGSSGSGKSTLMNMLGCLDRPTSGEYILGGRLVSAMKTDELALIRNEEIGFVFQSFELLARQSALENVELPLMYSATAGGFRARRERALSALQRVGLGNRVDHRPNQLSGGQKQRVAIARAVLKDPRVLILDEATSALDAESEHLVREALERLREGSRRDGSRRTTLVIAHRLSTIADADLVVVLEGGRIAQSGTHQQLMREEGIYRRLVERQFIAA